MFSAPSAGLGTKLGQPPSSITQKRQRRKIPPSGSHAIGALERKYQKTPEQLKQLEDADYEWEGRSGFDLANRYEIELRGRLRASLVSLENSIRMLDPKWSGKRLHRFDDSIDGLCPPRTVIPHVTIGVRVLTWVELLAEWSRTSAERSAFRRALPHGFVRRGDSRSV